MFAALCDDDKYIIEELKKLLLTYAKENRIIIDIDEFESGEKLLNSENNYDIIVLDFQLGSTDGLTVAKELRKRNVLSCIIFLTSYPHFMIDAFEVNTFRFLLKPIDKSKFFKAIDDYVKIVDANYPITLIQNKELKKINSNEICFIEADGKYSNIHLNSKVMHCSKTLSGVTNLLPKYCFVRTHRSFVVNLHYVKSYSSDTVYLSNGESAYLSKNYQKSFRTSYMNFLEKKLCEVIIYAILQLCGACSGTDCSFLLYFKNFCNCKIQAVLYSVTARCYHYGKHFYVHRRRTKKWGFTVSALCGIDIYACNIRIQ